jgi:nucleoside-diphosphate-sugar epimerase
MSAEHMTRVWCNENQVRRVVLRVPGIYGPNRIPIVRLQRLEPFIRLSEAGVTNRIHVDDLVTTCMTVASKTDARGVYNVTDGNSMSSTEFMRRVAQITELPAPREISLEEARLTLSAERMSFLDESRRVSNKRLLGELGLQLRYTNVDAGIRASL